ncbi:UDP-glucose 4-epimerase [candidate division WOR_3 bacterium SM23_60]|uniref:UDP-glucose 4-epimerase n=1 Tax=candidate division WOR_3 bacterium SM23_60 TaxID=1703780 RepID=A0A0S8GG10_UNCW3|nr:MAG: UDP-glucose 4-epimerase [candidate division WOR_3 bacterium SM23_60]
MKILVTGGCGFIGSHIVDAYINHGHDVAIIDNLSTGDIKNRNPQARFYQEDICSKDIEGIFAEEKFDTINHHAAQINVRTSVEDPLFDAHVNIIGSINLLTLAAKYGVKKFIFASSGGAIYGEPRTFPITEEFAAMPASPYGISKMTIEHYTKLFARLYDIDYFIFRYSNVYGPRQIAKSEAGVISIFIQKILNSGTCVIFGDGTQTRDYVYVSDVVAANVAALNHASQTLNIGTGKETSVNDLIHMLERVTKQKVAYEHGPERPGEVSRNVVDCSHARATIDWQPQVTLEQGMQETFDYFKKIS